MKPRPCGAVATPCPMELRGPSGSHPRARLHPAVIWAGKPGQVEALGTQLPQPVAISQGPFLGQLPVRDISSDSPKKANQTEAVPAERRRLLRSRRSGETANCT